MLGGDPYKNNFGNQIIIKCHECGDTDLRNVSFFRTASGEPSGYVCGNGHETWGAVDDWDIWGQSDVQLTPVKFFDACDAINENMPNSIIVQFSGILGVQARESCAQSISEDIRARLKMPIQHCGPCCESVNVSGNNNPWYINCGCDVASGPCSTSNDYTQNPYASCASDIQTITAECLGVDVTASIDKDSIQVFSNIPANPDGGVPGTPPAGSTWYSTGPSCAALTVPGATFGAACEFDPISPGFFAGGYPEAYGSSGPAFITEVAGSSGNLWSNQGHSINFIVRDQRHFHWIDPCDHSKGWCYAGKRTFYIAKRTHPTANATGNSGFTWSVSQEGIADPVIEFSCGIGDCGASWESPSIDPYSFVNFCNPSNGAIPCTNCNNSIGTMSVSYCNGDGQRRFWPFRVPYYKTPDGDYQLLRKDAHLYPTAWECNCRGAGSICDDTVSVPIFPDYCTKNIYYPDCLSHGTYKCADVDKRWRVPCSNPSEYFIGYLTSTGYESILNYRYSVDLSGPAATSDIKSAIITFNPIYEGRDGRADTFSFPVSPNPVCAGLDRKGYVSNFGDPTPTMRGGDSTYWYDNSSPIKYTAGAVGIRTARLSQIFALPEAQVQQPHCLRRVKNPNLSKSYPYYQVNTADVSQQRMILDRYYYTNDYFDYLWSGVQLAEPDVTGQPFINRQGDRGLFDFLTGQLYPYSFTSRSGSVEEPELVAVIHSQNGRGGQIAFQTMPVTSETDQLIDPAHALIPDTPYCDFKTRVHVLGYGVMYPLIDDPIWSNPIDTKEWIGVDYDPTNPIFDTTTVRKSAHEYPVFIPGTGYEIGDKIEFRAWRTLQNDASAFNPASEIESIWEEECVERIIATATITELNDERIAPKTVQQNLTKAFISVETIPCTGIKRYHEMWRLKSVNIKDDSDGGYSVGDAIQIRFSDTDGLGNTVYYSGTPPYVEVSATGVSGVIESVEIPVSGSGAFYKIIRTGGIRWYEFDEIDEDTGDYLISVGTCPCTYDVCSSGCNGCVSKDMYPDTHNKLDAVNDGFPGSPWHVCVTDDNIRNPETDKPYKLFCPPTVGSVACGSSCTYTAIYNGATSDSLGWILLNKDVCANHCGCAGYPSAAPTSYHQTASVDCYCSIPLSMDGISLMQGWGDFGGSSVCWPKNMTYEFPNKSDNYARCACSGDPVVPASYAYMDGRMAIPYRRAQYKYEWLPNISGFQTKVGDYLDDEITTEAKNEIIDSFLGYDACNPGKYDRFKRSYRWPPKQDSTKQPCRKKLNTTDPIPSGVTRTLDNYCRVYGFYQQRQPNCKNMLYRGQYIMRAAVKGAGFHDAAVAKLGDCDPSYYPQDGHGWSDCDPIVEDIVIGFNRMEAQFDISAGAPYNQDILIPENLPKPYIGPDGKKEVRPDAWDEPSLVGLNNPIYYDHGFYEPNRYHEAFKMALPEDQENLGVGEEPPTKWVFAINALMAIYDVDYGDGSTVDAGHAGIIDWPDPRNNCRGSCDQYTIPLTELYPDNNVPLHPTGIQSNFVLDCLYPWENFQAGVSGVDHYCMFQNNSAELTLGEIEYCSGCLGSVLIYDRSDERFYGPYFNHYGEYISYTHKIQYGSIDDPDNPGKSYKLYMLFRAYGTESDSFVVQAFRDVIDDYIAIWHDRYNDATVPIDKIFAADIHRSILWNMLFEGASNDKLQGLTKVEVFNLEVETEDLGSYGVVSRPVYYGRIFLEDRCEYHEHTGGIKSINVLNGGSGYAFEIEERIPATGIIGVNDALMTVTSIPVSKQRRRETYALATVGISHTGVGYVKDQVIDINFNDPDAAREGVVIVKQPKIKITEVNASGTITDFEIADPGEYYKYFKTGQHRAFPVALVLNNYWDYPSGPQNIGRHAKLTPVIGVDPADSGTYGTIKRVDVEFAGIEYVAPGQYWAINTKMGDYDDYDNIKNGLDIQHLVDPCKYSIAGDGLNTHQVNEYYDWMYYPENNPNGTLFFPERQAMWVESPNENIEPSIGDPFIYSKKYYLRTRNTSPHVTKWAEKVKDWNTIIISGASPVDASGGLLNRTYHMALVEEAYLHSKRAHTGFCNASECEEYIDWSDISCNEDGAIYPGQQRVKECGTPCPVFTVYDAHRFNIEGTAQLKEDLFARPGPWLLGCPQRLVLDTEAKKQLYCYDAYQITYGGQLQTQGYTSWDMIANPIDQCFNADYSLYAEFGKWTNGANQTNVPAMRIKAITYGMQGPITMKVSYNTERDKRAIPVDYDDGQCDNTEPRPSSPPTPAPTPTPSSFPPSPSAQSSIGEIDGNVVVQFAGTFATAGTPVNSMNLEQKRNFVSARTDANLEQLSLSPNEGSQYSYNVIWLMNDIPAFATGNNSAFYADTYNVSTPMMLKAGQPAIYIDRDYVPGTYFSNQIVFSGLTLADLGITQDMDYTVFTRETRERFRIVIEVPDPIV